MERIARICWNTQDWKRPSGSVGKSLSDGSYEKELDLDKRSGSWMIPESMPLMDITMVSCNH